MVPETLEAGVFVSTRRAGFRSAGAVSARLSMHGAPILRSYAYMAFGGCSPAGRLIGTTRFGCTSPRRWKVSGESIPGARLSPGT